MYIKSNFIEISRFENKFEKFKDIPFSFFFDYIPTLQELSLNPINIFAHDEPNEYFGHHDWLLQNKNCFSLILTWNDKILKECDNARLLLFGEGWVDDKKGTIEKNYNKEFEVSFIRGKKLISYGHQIRHKIFNRQNEINIPHRFYAETNISNFDECIQSKVMAHGKSMFSIIIENTSHNNYFTEKITDCILMKTIPIYWGCSNIEEFYDMDGIIKFENDSDAIEKINNLTPEYYLSRLDIIEKNWKKAFEYKNYLSRITNTLEETFKLNNLL
jgi:hypothetical protein